MRRINRQRREHRADFGTIEILKPFEVGLGQVIDGQEPDSVPRQVRSQLLAPTTVLLFDHPSDAPGNGAECLGRGEAIRAALGSAALDLLFDARHPHLKEFVEVRAGDAKKFHPFQQRVLRVKRLVKDALVKLQPTQFPIEKASGQQR